MHWSRFEGKKNALRSFRSSFRLAIRTQTGKMVKDAQCLYKRGFRDFSGGIFIFFGSEIKKHSWERELWGKWVKRRGKSSLEKKSVSREILQIEERIDRRSVLKQVSNNLYTSFTDQIHVMPHW